MRLIALRSHQRLRLDPCAQIAVGPRTANLRRIDALDLFRLANMCRSVFRDHIIDYVDDGLLWGDNSSPLFSAFDDSHVMFSLLVQAVKTRSIVPKNAFSFLLRRLFALSLMSRWA